MFRLVSKGETFVALDTETTGLNCLTERIIEIGAVKFNSSGIIDYFQTLINPQKTIPYTVFQITGINDQMVEKSPDFSQIAPDLLNFLQDSILIGHNIQFDLRFLKVELERIHKKELLNPVVDTLQFARWAFPENEKYRQTYLAEQLGINVKEAHRAGDDAKVCGDIFLHLIKETAERQKL